MADGLASHPLAQLTLTRFREVIREPEAVFWTFVFPLLLAAGLGVAFRSRPADVVAVAVVADAPAGDAVAAALGAEPGLAVRKVDSAAAARALRTGEVALVVVPRGPDAAEYRFDDTRPEGRAARGLADAALQRAAGRTDPVAATDAIVREPGSRYIDFVMPGLLGLNLLGSGIWTVGFGIVSARQKKLLKRLVATPMSRAQYLASYLLSRLVFLAFEVAVLVGFGAIAFGVPVRGPLPVLAAICLLGAFAFSGLGLLVAARPTTIEGASGLMNLVMLPMWVFSGVFFSSSRFPEAVQPLIQALPLTAVNDALRANLLRGAGFAEVAPELAILAGWLVATFGLALRVFRWR